MSEPTHVLAIDQGTTGTTVLVLDRSGRVAGAAYGELTQHFPRPGWVEHDPGEIWSSVVELSDVALAKAGIEAASLAALGVTNQRETTIVWERASGEPVHDAIVWQDRRSAGICRRLAASGAAELVAERTGLRLDPYFSATKLAWLFEHVDGLRARAERGELCAGTVDSFLMWKMTGGALHATDPTNASRTLLMDLRTLAWDDELCELFGVPPAVLPAIGPSARVFGECSSELFGGVAVPIGAALGDQQAALFGQACFTRGQTKNTYGTGSFVLQHVGDAPPADAGELVATVACTKDGEPAQYALEGSIFATGAAVQWLRDGLRVVADAAETEGLAASLEGNDDVWFVPALAGMGSPVWDPAARGTLLGVTGATSRAHLARAVLEAIAYQSRDVLEALSVTGEPVTELRVDGGAAANAWLMQFQADIAGVPIDVAAIRETTGVGAAYAAGLAVGLWPGRAALEELRVSGRRFEPAMGERAREALYARWLEARERALHWARPEQ